MGDALDDIVKGMNFDADKKDHKPKVFCSICHGGILEKRMFHNLALKDDDDYVDLTIRVGGKDYGPMHVKCFKCTACHTLIGTGQYSVRDGCPVLVLPQISTLP